MSTIKEKPANMRLMKELVRAAVGAIENQHFFDASIIIFQTVEGLLRIAIKAYGERQGISKANLHKCAENERSFWRLVLHLDMVCPENGLGKRLLALNGKRNKVMHRIFYDFDSLEHLGGETRSFCKEAMELNVALQALLGAPNLDRSQNATPQETAP